VTSAGWPCVNFFILTQIYSKYDTDHDCLTMYSSPCALMAKGLEMADAEGGGPARKIPIKCSMYILFHMPKILKLTPLLARDSVVYSHDNSSKTGSTVVPDNLQPCRFCKWVIDP
jgi:hypothetical protein